MSGHTPTGIGWLSILGTDQWTAVAGATGIGALVLTFLGVAINWWPLLTQWRLRIAMQRDFGADAFDEETIRRAVENYIPPFCTNVDPAGEADLRQVLPIKNPLIEVMDDFLINERAEKFVLILADSGMGKTSFLLNYYARNRKLRHAKRLRIAIVPLGRADSIERIKAIADQRTTDVFLDAFDEDTKAVEDHRERLRTLMEACSDFRRVVVTCRSQFFSNEDEIPRETGVAIVGPRRAGEGPQYRFYKTYISPFTDAMVKQYLKRRFPIPQWRRRAEAFRLVQSIPELSLRPMLLAVVPDLVLHRTKARTISDVYNFMLESWLERESTWIPAASLRELSKMIAVNIYLLREKRGSERITRKELAQLLDMQAPDLDKWRLTTRSLLNRDALGNLKFAHRSIMEFLFVRAFLEGEELCAYVEWTDLMKELFVSSIQSNPQLLRSMPSISAEELRVTGFFPIGSINRTAGRLTRKEVTRQTKSSPASGVALALWRSVLQLRGDQCAWMRSERMVAGVRIIDDYASATAWMIAIEPRHAFDPVHLIDPITIQVNQTELNRLGFGGHNDWQLPTLAHIDYLLSDMDGAREIRADVLYWTCDLGPDGGVLAISVGEAALVSEDLILLGKREVASSATLLETQSLFVYELRLRQPKSLDRYPTGAPIWNATKDVRRDHSQPVISTGSQRKLTSYIRTALLTPKQLQPKERKQSPR